MLRCLGLGLGSHYVTKVCPNFSGEFRSICFSATTVALLIIRSRPC